MERATAPGQPSAYGSPGVPDESVDPALDYDANQIVAEGVSQSASRLMTFIDKPDQT